MSFVCLFGGFILKKKFVYKQKACDIFRFYVNAYHLMTTLPRGLLPKAGVDSASPSPPRGLYSLFLGAFQPSWESGASLNLQPVLVAFRLWLGRSELRRDESRPK